MSVTLNEMKKGFTLIELLVSITILMVLIGLAVISFLDYSEKRSVSNAAGELKATFSSLKNSAQAGSLGGCTELGGYRLQTATTESGSQIITQAICLAGTANSAETIVLDDVTISPVLDITFNTLGKGLDLDGGVTSQTITVNREEYIYSFDVFRDGQVSEGAWQ